MSQLMQKCSCDSQKFSPHLVGNLEMEKNGMTLCRGEVWKNTQCSAYLAEQAHISSVWLSISQCENIPSVWVDYLQLAVCPREGADHDREADVREEVSTQFFILFCRHKYSIKYNSPKLGCEVNLCVGLTGFPQDNLQKAAQISPDRRSLIRSP